MTRGILSLLLFFLPYSLSAQSTIYSFDILLDGSPIGILKATKNVNGKKVIKNISSNTNTKVLLLSVHIESEIYATYENDFLVSSFAYRFANRGVENIETTVKRQQAKNYQVVKNGKSRLIENEDIKYCVSDLYFTEPIGHTTVFSNTHGDFVKLEHVADGRYKLLLPDGKFNLFTYQNGKLVKVEVPLSVGFIIFKRKAA